MMRDYQVWKNTHSNKFYKPYAKQQLLHREGKEYRQRMFLAGNRCGKTYSSSMEGSFHLTGLYPDDWEGLRFDGPINMWAASVTTESTRDILQAGYLGDITNKDVAGADVERGITPFGCGSIPRECILDYVKRRGTPDAVDIVKVQHYNSKGEPDGVSTLGFKAYDQGREKFQGTARHFIHLDEEPPYDIYEECLMRLAGKGIRGYMLISMTPLQGMTEVCQSFLDNTDKNKCVVQMEWSEAGHLSDDEKQELLAGIPLYQREAREKGIPVLGTGRVYPVPESQISCEPFAIPDHFPRAFAMDFGWSNPTAAMFGAVDPNTDTLYIYDEYRVSEQEPASHATVLLAKDAKWIPGVCDPSGLGTSATDGKVLIEEYQKLGIDLSPANNSVDAGTMLVLNRMKAGKIKVFSTMTEFFKEFRVYSRDSNGGIKKKNDHLMDAFRYLVVSGQPLARTKPMYTQRFQTFTPRVASWKVM